MAHHQLNQKELVSLKELLVSQMAMPDVLSRLLIQKGVTAEDEFYSKLKEVKKQDRGKKSAWMKMALKPHDLPRTHKEALDQILAPLPLKHKARIAKTDKENLDDLYFRLGMDIRNEFGIWTRNRALPDSCISHVGENRNDPGLARPFHPDEREASDFLLAGSNME
jgi:hypothetical protein